MHHFSYKNNSLHCEDVDLADVSREVGTPFYAYSSATILGNFRRLSRALSPLDFQICYAMKANSNLSVLGLLAGAGAAFDIVSAGELFRVLQAGGKASECTFAGVAKTESEILYALEHGIYCFNVESEEELKRIDRLAEKCGKKAPVAVRVNPDVDAKTHKFISTGKSKNKFGIGLDRAAEVYAAAAKCKHLVIRGVQSHIGSQILETKPFGEACAKLAPFVQEMKSLHGLEFFSFGGGVGIVYDPALQSGDPAWWEDPGHEKRITPEDYAATIVPILKPLGLKILFEPGRFLVGNAGVLVTEVQYLKETPAKKFVIVDAGMNDLIRPALYEGYHEIVPLKKSDLATEVVDVVGPVCESGDFFAQDRGLPPVEQGDLLAVLSAGAYGFVMSSNYNSRPMLPEILVDGSAFRVVRKRQTFEDLIQGEIPAESAGS